MAEIHDDENGLLRRSDMTLRDWFAGQALVAAGVDFTAVDMQWFEQVGTRRAYRIADAMMEARKK